MRFALLGNHPDGIQLAQALVLAGRHQVLVHTTPVPDALMGAGARQVNDLEEILADPTIDAVIIASPAPGRPFHLRRALQSERHVLCVYPPDQTPEAAYEAAMIQKDTGFVLFPLLPDRQHPALGRLCQLTGPSGPLGELQLLEFEWSAPGPVLLNTEAAGHKLSFPGWDVLRRLGGEIAEVMGFAGREEVPADEPVLVAGRFELGGLLRIAFLPGQAAAGCRLTLIGAHGLAVLECPEGWRGSARLTWPAGEVSWPGWNPWPAVVEHFEAALKHPAAPAGKNSESWQDAIRMQELDDASRRSIEKRRGSLLEYPDPTEEVGFKGTMTLLGCGVLWLVVFLLILSRWLPLVGWLAIPVLAVFLILQLLRFVIPQKPR